MGSAQPPFSPSPPSQSDLLERAGKFVTSSHEKSYLLDVGVFGEAARYRREVAEPFDGLTIGCVGWVGPRKPRHGHARGRHGNATVVIPILPLT
jgi:hypothetical protein